MLQIYRRHLKSCPHTSRSYRRCACPIWVQGTLGGETIRRALDVTSIEAASNLVTVNRYRLKCCVIVLTAVSEKDLRKLACSRVFRDSLPPTRSSN